MRQRRIKKTVYSGMIFLFLLIWAAVMAAPGAWAGDVLIIGNQDIKADETTKKEIKSIFLGEKVKWADGADIRFVLLLGGIHKHFLKEYLGVTSAQYRNYWKKKVFTGQARSPKSFKKPEKLLDYMAKTSGVIGYIPSDAAIDSYGGKIKGITVK